MVSSKLSVTPRLSLIDLAASLKQPSAELKTEIERNFSYRGPWTAIDPKLVRKLLLQAGFTYPQKVVSFQMLKGGVAKTTSALHFGIRAASYGARVLFLDLDQQANLSFALGVEDESLAVWVDIVEKKLSVNQAIVSISEGVDLIPSNLNNSVLDRVLLNSHRNWAQAVKGPIESIRSQYDLIIIDTAPNLSAINTAVTCASDLVILPINPDRFSLLGVRKHLEDLNEVKKDFNLSFEKRVLFTKFDGRESLSKEILGQCIEMFDDLLLRNYIRTSSEIKSAIGSRNIFDRQSSAKEDYDSVTKEILG